VFLFLGLSLELGFRILVIRKLVFSNLSTTRLRSSSVPGRALKRRVLEVLFRIPETKKLEWNYSSPLSLMRGCKSLVQGLLNLEILRLYCHHGNSSNIHLCMHLSSIPYAMPFHICWIALNVSRFIRPVLDSDFGNPTLSLTLIIMNSQERNLSIIMENMDFLVVTKLAWNLNSVPRILCILQNKPFGQINIYPNILLHRPPHWGVN